MKKYRYLSFWIFLLSVISCANSKKKRLLLNEKGELVDNVDLGDSESEVQCFFAMAGPSENAETNAAKKHTAYQAAKALVMADIAEYIYGAKIEGYTNVKDAVLVDSVVSTSIKAFLRGVKISKLSWTKQHECTVEVNVDLKKLKKDLNKMGLKVQSFNPRLTSK